MAKNRCAGSNFVCPPSHSMWGGPPKIFGGALVPGVPGYWRLNCVHWTTLVDAYNRWFWAAKRLQAWVRRLWAERRLRS